MKIIKKHTLILSIFLLLFSCNNDNLNPNAPSKLSAKALLSGAQRSFPELIDATTPMLYTQYLSNGLYNNESRYQNVNWSYNSFYTKPLQNLNAIIKLNTDKKTRNDAAVDGGNNDNQIAVAKILRVYFIQSMTNRWGMLPYTEANKGLGENGNIYPKFDSQEIIYRGLFDELNDALSRINNNQGVKGDYILKGNMTRWKEFGNSLKLIMALRLSRRNSDLNNLPKKMFNEAFSLGSLITSHQQNIYYPYIIDEIDDNPWSDRFISNENYLISDTFMNVLNNQTSVNLSDDDPRVLKYSTRPRASSNALKNIGAPYGESNSEARKYSMMNYDIIGFNGGKNNFQGIILTAAQINFSLAEGVELGWISSSTAKDYFEKGIKESMLQWNVDQATADSYINTISYSGIKDIALQKWISMYMQGYESWAEWRRFNADGNAPELKTEFNQLNGTGIIKRQAYGSTAAGLNKVNYEKAIKEQGPDNLDTKLWYFK